MGPAKKACEAIERNDVDLILASGEPWVSFNLAQFLSRKIGCPYVLDYHDLLTGNPFASPKYAQRIARREGELISMSSAITVVSQSWAEDLVSRFNPVSKVHVIPNGYDSEMLDSIEPENFDHPAIVYAGCFYPPKSVITPVMAALKRCDQDDALSGRPWQFHYYGRDEGHVLREAARFGLGRRVVIHGMLERPKAIAGVKGADACVVITSVCESLSVGDRGFITSKLYETLGAGTPIVLITPEGSEAHVMSKSYSHIARFAGDDALGLASHFKTLITSGIQKAAPATEYSWARLTEDLDTILQGVIESSARK
jgi:glycosyltransferase involved in cell wall biosynthesis